MGARDLLNDLAEAGITIRADRNRLLIRPAERLTDDMRQALRAAKAELLAELGARPARADPAALPSSPVRPWRLSKADADRCHWPTWNDDEIAAFVARHARLLAHGLSDGDADDLAERLTLRDRDGDTRHLCIECANFRGRRCRQAERAGVGGPEVGALALILQNCSAFGPIGGEAC